MKKKNIALAVSTLLLYCCFWAWRPSDRAVASGDPAGCYALSVGNISWLRPGLLLSAPGPEGHANYMLSRGKYPKGLSQSWHWFSADTSHWDMWWSPEAGSFVIKSFQVDWGYRITLKQVSGDSVKGYWHSSGDYGPNGRARVVGRRIECPVVPDSSKDS